jgi:polyhydroxybutyrate depolymerase
VTRAGGSAPGARPALVLNLHGFTSSMTQQAGYSRVPAQAAARGWVTVTPQGLGRMPRWTVPPMPGTDDAGFLFALLAQVEAEMATDTRRVYATGISNGAAMVTKLATMRPARFAAIAPVAGINAVWVEPPTTPPVPVIAFHGTDDKLVPFSGGRLFAGVRRGGSRGPLRQRRAGGFVLDPVESVMTRWAVANGCTDPPQVAMIGTDVRHVVYPGSAHGAAELYAVQRGGHTWPGSVDVPMLGMTTHTIDATSLMLDFFARFAAA